VKSSGVYADCTMKCDMHDETACRLNMGKMAVWDFSILFRNIISASLIMLVSFLVFLPIA
jgi:hypothetical protein